MAEEIIAKVSIAFVLGEALTVHIVFLRSKAEIVGIDEITARFDAHTGTVESIGESLAAGSTATGQDIGIEQTTRLIGQFDGERTAKSRIGKRQDRQRRIEQRGITAHRDHTLTDGLTLRHLMDFLVRLR